MLRMHVPHEASRPVRKSAGHVLIADDDPASRGALASVLQRAGFACVVSESALEAFGLLEGADFDLIVADICMPGNAGLEMVGALAKRAEAPPVILVTGQPSLESAMQAVRLRVFDYLLKPVEAAKLVDLARAGVASRRMLQVMRDHRERLRTTLSEIDRCEEIAKHASGTAANAALVTFLGVAVQQSIATIADIGNLAEAVMGGDLSGETQRRLQDSRPLLLVDAIRETVHVLEQTKGAFRSRELGELRKKLERLLGNGRAG